MSRWLIEKSGTGIEKSGTGIEKSGTGIEKSGTGIEKSGTGIEKSGTGIRKGFLVLALTAVSFVTQVSAATDADPAGSMQIVVNENSVAVSWIVDGSVFSGVSSLSGSFANLSLTEIGLANDKIASLDIAGSSSGASKNIAGAGSGVNIAGAGSGVNIAGAGSGVNIAGAGSGVNIAGAGSGVNIAGAGSGVNIAGAGSGVNIAGAGSGVNIAGAGSGVNIAGAGSGADATTNGHSQILIAGAGSGADSIVITLPGGTDMQMEVALGCNSASVSILDSNFSEVVSFSNVPVIGASAFCVGGNQGYGLIDRGMPVEARDRK